MRNPNSVYLHSVLVVLSVCVVYYYVRLVLPLRRATIEAANKFLGPKWIA